MENADMLITKKWLRERKQRLAERLEKIVTIVDQDHLVAEVKKLCGVNVGKDTPRSELIHYVVKWIVEDELPSAVVD